MERYVGIYPIINIHITINAIFICRIEQLTIIYFCQVSKEVWKELGSMGFLGISIPEEKGGVGGTFLDEAIVLEEQVFNIIFVIWNDIEMQVVSQLDQI